MARVLALLLLIVAAPAWAQGLERYDPDPAWPLCGRIADHPPPGWYVYDGCPADRWGTVEATDLPLSSTFGPRQKASEGFRYDYHRGIDIPTPVNTPVFAIASGQVTLAGLYPSYEDVVAQVRHFRPNHTSCLRVGCYHSNYVHMSHVMVVPGQWVEKGELIGFTGTSVSGFAHLHFEIRDAPGFDPFSNWQRDAVHPLRVLPYADDSTPEVFFDRVDTADPSHPRVVLRVRSVGLDVSRVELVLYDQAMDMIEQPGNSLDPYGYNVYPSWFDIEEWNFQYSHKDTADWPWAGFGAGGAHECPFHGDHGASYWPHVHLDRQAPLFPSIGVFNGLILAPAAYSVASHDYQLTLGFEELVGPAGCIEARVSDIAGNEHVTTWGQCIATWLTARLSSSEREAPRALPREATRPRGASRSGPPIPRAGPEPTHLR